MAPYPCIAASPVPDEDPGFDPNDDDGGPDWSLADENEHYDHDDCCDDTVREPLQPPDGWQFPLECLPRPLAEHIASEAWGLGVDQSVIAVAHVVAAAASIDGTYRVQVENDWVEPALLRVRMFHPDVAAARRGIMSATAAYRAEATLASCRSIACPPRIRVCWGRDMDPASLASNGSLAARVLHLVGIDGREQDRPAAGRAR